MNTFVQCLLLLARLVSICADSSSLVNNIILTPSDIKDDSSFSLIDPSIVVSFGIADFRRNLHRYHEELSTTNIIERNMSISFWIITKDKGKIITSVARVPFEHETNSFWLYIDSRGYLAFEDSHKGRLVNSQTEVVTMGMISDGDWHNVVFVKSGNLAKFFVDSREVHSFKLKRSLSYPAAALCICADCTNVTDESNRIAGMMDDYVIYNRAVSGSEIIQIFSSPPHEVSPCPSTPQYNLFIAAFRKQLSSKTVSKITLHYVLDTMDPPQSEEFILEFGVWYGGSINRIASRFRFHKIYGFDSFLGLPEDWSYPWIKGSFNLSGQSPQTYDNVELIKGWFNETLPLFARETLGDSKIALLHVDCDLYSSTKTIFDNLWPNIHVGTIIIFDELLNFINYENQEIKALYEFIIERDIRFEILATECVGMVSCQSVDIQIV